MSNVFQIQLRLGFLIATFGLVVSCLITNCPRGGKRSEVVDGIQSYPESNSIDCTPCGSGNEGVCIDRGICCSKGAGCHTSPQQCQNISTFQSSCFSELLAPACGDKGRCRSRFICCLKDHCMWDLSCISMPSVKYKDRLDLKFHLFSTLLQGNRNFPTGMIEDENRKPKYDGSVLTSDYDS